MKIKFEKLGYQEKAWQSAVNIFEGQEICTSTFSMPSVQSDYTGDMADSNLGVANKLLLIEEEILENVQKTQIHNGLKQSKELPSKDFTVEMETGTGKTYVYLRSMFEMHKKYGFSKFVIVVPSIAIKEGVNKTLEMTRDHFKSEYNNTPYEFFTYNSDKLEQVRNFATSENLQIMVINIDAFRKSFTNPDAETKANVIHRWNDKMQGRPIDFIRGVSPVVIIDEPQSVDTTAKSAEAIKSLNPLCTFRYSATHVDKHHMLYKLDSIDAYEEKLVKQIEVASIQVEDSNNKAYMKLLKVDNKKSPIQAQLQLDVKTATGVARKSLWVKQGDDLAARTKRSIYEGYTINDIYCEEGNEYIDFQSVGGFLRLDESWGDVSDIEYKRLQIRKTIEEHLDKELKLTPKGIKILSLFFIDKVANYRDYNAEDAKGVYAKIFEEEYSKAIAKPKYSSLFKEVDTTTLVSDVHNGYFSTDNKGVAKDTKGNTKADEDTYSLIMKEKEKLLSFNSKLKFIFSHSALKEGWDNPNVFQICTLNETKSTIKKRQEIGRGLRLAVNQDGQRIHGHDINTLTVMANESYEDFVSTLQKEMEKEENIKFGFIEDHLFANIVVLDDNNEEQNLGQEDSEVIYKHLLEQKYIDSKGKAQDSLKLDLRNNEVRLPEEFKEQEKQIVARIKKVVKGLDIKNNEDKKSVKLNKEVRYSPEFDALWDKIKHKTYYNVDFNPAGLVDNCAERLSRDISITKAKFSYKKAEVEVKHSGLDTKSKAVGTYNYDVLDYPVPDIISELQSSTNLKRKTIVDILVKSDTLDQFAKNPQMYISQIKKLIELEMQKLIIDGIKYHKLGSEEYPVQELFDLDELKGYLNKNMVPSDKSAFDHIVYDSDIEKTIAEEFEVDDNIKLYLKLPSKFKIDTPLGGYNPDWAVLFEQDGNEKLYFVLESKGTLFEEALRGSENYKIKCGQEHFKALDNGTKYEVINSRDSFYSKI